MRGESQFDLCKGDLRTHRHYHVSFDAAHATAEQSFAVFEKEYALGYLAILSWQGPGDELGIDPHDTAWKKVGESKDIFGTDFRVEKSLCARSRYRTDSPEPCWFK